MSQGPAMNRRSLIGAAAVMGFAAQAAADPASLPPKLLEGILEQYRRTLGGSFEAWCRHALAPIGQGPARHHSLIASALQDVAEGRCDRLMLLLPPGSAKSTYASDLYPPWFLARAPRMNVIAASHTAGLAEQFGRRARERLAEHGSLLGTQLADTGTAAGNWRTANGGTYYAVGVGGSVTGRRADLALVDDPIASREDAESQRIRDKTWDWFTADLLTRLKPSGRVVLVQTRWHPDDPAGRLLAQEGDRWRVLRLPAIAEDAGDPLGRAMGQALWPEWEDEAALADKRQRVGEREWASLFQQRPRVQGGGLFKVAMIGAVPALPAAPRLVRAWDLAATRATGTRDPDWTVGVLLAALPGGRWCVADVARMQGGPEEVEQAILSTAQRDRAAHGAAVQIGLPQDPGQAGKAQVAYLTAKLAGHTVESSPETGDKATRAGPVAAQCNVGNVSLLAAPWNRAFLAELADFPAGTKDDQVDALSRAFGMLSEPQAAPARAARVPHMGR